jgi:DNA-directed RNA polymerase subunit RPC12/RpoP
MTLFSISCETCSARLKVRSVRALGQIIACPKCGSMIQVVPPEGWEAPAAKLAQDSQGSGELENAHEEPADAALEHAAEAEGGRGVLWVAVGATLVVLLTLAGGGWWLMREGKPLAQNDAASLPRAAEQDPAPAATEETSATEEATLPVDKDTEASAEAEKAAVAVDGNTDAETATTAAPPTQENPPAAAGATEQDAKPASEESTAAESPAQDAGKDAAAAPPAAEQTAQPASEPAKGEPPTPRVSSQDLRSRLGAPLAGLKFKDVPVAEVLETLSQLAGVPIALDAHHVPDAGRLATRPISADLQATTVGAAAATVTRGLGLEGVLSEGQVLLLPRGLRAGKPSKQTYDLTEIIAPLDEAQAAGLREFLSQVAGAALPNTPEVALTIEPAQHRLVAESIACIRAARQSSPAAPTAKIAWGRTLTLNFREAAPLMRILAEFEQEARATLLVDWPALADAGLALDSQVSFVVHDQPLSEVFEQFVSAQKLAWIRLDDDALLLTSPAAAASFRQVRSYSLETFGPQVRDATQLTATLRAAAPGEPPQVWLDPVSRTAIVVGSAALHEQVARSQTAAE